MQSKENGRKKKGVGGKLERKIKTRRYWRLGKQEEKKKNRRREGNVSKKNRKEDDRSGRMRERQKQDKSKEQ